MRDQADKLRKIIDDLKMRESAFQSSEHDAPASKRCRVITVTSGKGGVGRRTFR
ncbi:MAG: hypothetical protein MJB12_07880 [Firmicutes bacterium]|nr:hypothetical protein [Bacillota bacterium]